MPRTLYAKLSLALVALLALVGLVYAFLSISTTRHYLEEVNQQLNQDLARNLVADRNLVQAGRLNKNAIKGMFHEYMTINPSIEIYLLDPDGTILAFSADPGKVKRKKVSLEPIRAFLSGEAPYPLMGDDPRSHDRRKGFSVTPVPSEDEVEGYLYVVLRGERYDMVDQIIEESYFLRLSAWAMAGGLAFALAAGLLVFHLLTRRLQKLTSRMREFRESGFQRFSTASSSTDTAAGAGGEADVRRDGDEVDQLSATFEHMAEKIGSQIEALRGEDAKRREMVAQVSHDLRTPLAALHGYLQTMQIKQDQIGDAERREYLTVALANSERLRRLVDELFELAKLEAHEAHPQCEPFSLGELVEDVSQGFRLRAETAGSSLKTTTDAALPLVTGDIALIERVLENLIDNALRYTPGGGRVSIELAEAPTGVAVKVVDQGPGIAPGEIARVFDAFYQAGNPHRGDGHAGLGLAIAKRIVDLHGGTLYARNRTRGGCEFGFSLPLWQGGSLA